MAETKTLQFDDGLLRLDINGNGILTFNPSDFNVYQRFFGLLKELPELEKRYAAEVEQPGSEDDSFALAGRELDRARELDREIKDKLGAAFGPGNDFDALLGGVNLMAVGNNGQRVITNLLNALAPYIEEGAKRHQQEAAEAALRSRAQRRAVQQG
ncbi:MAG: hypothetical protein HFF40_00290 [Lawsonibacter sp.]|jgi:hypothetical protein|uniref:hypothetical protein n=1 Tax=Lawsonibacter sp. JLR.KK007 TaxID=3114293 RepID=UPI0021725C13|nr:hypothetical protein [Lawsonibacter sp.]